MEEPNLNPTIAEVMSKTPENSPAPSIPPVFNAPSEPYRAPKESLGLDKKTLTYILIVCLIAFIGINWWFVSGVYQGNFKSSFSINQTIIPMFNNTVYSTSPTTNNNNNNYQMIFQNNLTIPNGYVLVPSSWVNRTN